MRRLAKIFGWLLAGLVLVLLTLPWWLGLVLGGVARALQTTYGRYERLGYGRFALHEVVVNRSEVTVRVDRAEADTPALWAWRRLRGNSRDIVVGRWRVDVLEREPRVESRRESGWALLQPRLRRIAAGLDRWLPSAQIGEGSVHWRNGGLTMASAHWGAGTLEAKAVNALVGAARTPVRWPKADVVGVFPKDAEVIRAQVHDLVFDEIVKIESRGSDASGEIVWQNQRATVKGGFGVTGWVPATMEFSAVDWTVPGAQLKLGEIYSTVRGGARVEWRDAKILVQVDAKGEPAAEKKAPPLEVQLRGQGDAATLTIETARVLLPGIAANLSQPVTIGREGRLQTGGARFSVDVDLAKQPWFPATGVARGEFIANSAGAAVPIADFSLGASNLAVSDWKLASFEAKGRFEWPRVVVTSAAIVPAAGERIDVQGGWDLQKREIFDGKLTGQVRRQSFARWLPSQPQFDRVSVEAQAAGPLTALEHSGKLAAEGVKVSVLKPVGLTGQWRGSGAALSSFNAHVTAGASVVDAEGAVAREGLTLNKFVLQQQGTERLHLSGPATIRWRPSLAIEALHLVGSDAAIDLNLAWGSTGRVDVAAKQVSPNWFSDLLSLAGPTWQLEALNAKGSWSNGPLNLELQANGALDLGDVRQAGVSLAMRGDKDGLRIESLRVAEQTSPIVNATGKLGLVIFPTETPMVRISPDAPLSLEVLTESNAAFWQRLKDLSGLELKDPEATARITGTWAKPQGEVKFQAARVAADPARFKWKFPTVEGLDLRLTGDTGGVKLDAFSVKVEGQDIRAAGRLVVKGGNWGEIFSHPLLVARRDTDLHVEIPDADLAPLARYVPGYLAPQGKLQADLKFTAGGSWDGHLRLRDAASRPLGPLGVLQDVSADVRLVGYTMELESVTAKAGGQPVTLTGKVEMPIEGEPRFDLALKGDNLPFVRQTGLLLRGDLDLKLETPANAPGRLSGTVNLRDSLFLEDVRSMIPGGPRGGNRRPPYFSVATAPLNDWQVDVAVRGQRFMRLRTTVFSGVASARFRLLGTLGDPRAIGEVTIDEGSVLLPFATFSVQQGRVSLSEADPYEPQLYVTGTSRRYGYDVRMELTGTASTPNIVFTSSPPLDSEQVLLMVMAGETPRNEVTYTGNQRFARIGTFLGQSLLNNLGGDVASADRLSISTGDNISRQGRETYNIEYQLNNRWSIVGEYDEFDDYNAGVKWRFYSKGGRDDEKK